MIAFQLRTNAEQQLTGGSPAGGIRVDRRHIRETPIGIRKSLARDNVNSDSDTRQGSPHVRKAEIERHKRNEEESDLPALNHGLGLGDEFEQKSGRLIAAPDKIVDEDDRLHVISLL